MPCALFHIIILFRILGKWCILYNAGSLSLPFIYLCSGMRAYSMWCSMNMGVSILMLSIIYMYTAHKTIKMISLLLTLFLSWSLTSDWFNILFLIPYSCIYKLHFISDNNIMTSNILEKLILKVCIKLYFVQY